MIVSFETEPPQGIQEGLKKLKFKRNPFRKKWHGYGKKSEIETLTQNQQARIEEILDD